MLLYYFYLGYLTHYILSVRQKAGESTRSRTNKEDNREDISKLKYIIDTLKHCQSWHVAHLLCGDHIGQSIFTNQCLFLVSNQHFPNSVTRALATGISLSFRPG